MGSVESFSDAGFAGTETMATGSMSGVAILRVGSEMAPDVATELGAAKQWSGDALRPGALSGHSPHGGLPSSGQQSP